MPRTTNPSSNQVNITMCGDGGCGKSSITLRLVKSAWTNDYDPTIEDSYSLTRTINGIAYVLSITDTAGQEEYRSMASTYSRSADAFVLVYDITNPDSLFQQLPYFVDLIRMESESRAERGEVEPVMLVAGNKCDLQEQRRVSAREGLEWARAVGAGFMETSALNSVNIEESFAVLVTRVVEAREAHAIRLQERGRSGTGVGVGSANQGHQHGDSWSKTQPLPPIGDEYVEEKRPRQANWFRRLKCW